MSRELTLNLLRLSALRLVAAEGRTYFREVGFVDLVGKDLERALSCWCFGVLR